MKEFVGTIGVRVPINVLYSALKEYYLSPLEGEWRRSTKSLLMTPRSLSKDVPNSELISSAAQMGGEEPRRDTCCVPSKKTLRKARIK